MLQWTCSVFDVQSLYAACAFCPGVMSSTTLPQLKDGRQILKCVLVIVPANSFKGLDDALVIKYANATFNPMIVSKWG